MFLKVIAKFRVIFTPHSRRLAKEGGWIIIGQIASVTGALVLVRVLTEHLDPEQYGQLALGLTVATLVNQVVMGGIMSGIGRFYSIAVEMKDLEGYLCASCRLLGYATQVVLIIGLVLLAGLNWLGYEIWVWLAVAALIFSVLSSCNSTLNGIQNAARQRAIVAFHGGLDAWLKILLGLGVMLWLGSTSLALMIGYCCSSLLIAVSQLFFLRRIFPKGNRCSGGNSNFVQQMWAYSWPFSVWGIFSWMQQVSDRWALQAFVSTAEVGQYAVLFQIGYTPIALVTTMAMTFLGPILYQRSGNATDGARNAQVHRLGWQMAIISLIVTFFGVTFTFIMHEWVFRLLVATTYRKVSYLLPWLVLAGGVFAAGQILALKLMSEMKSAKMVSAKIVTALLGVLFNIYGASKAGLPGVVAALVAFSLIYLVWMILLAAKAPHLETQ